MGLLTLNLHPKWPVDFLTGSKGSSGTHLLQVSLGHDDAGMIVLKYELRASGGNLDADACQTSIPNPCQWERCGYCPGQPVTSRFVS